MRKGFLYTLRERERERVSPRLYQQQKCRLKRAIKKEEEEEEEEECFDLVACCVGCGWVVAGHWGWGGERGTAYNSTFYAFV
jgi:hypothetical protein